jgi:hypothetical protein
VNPEEAAKYWNIRPAAQTNLVALSAIRWVYVVPQISAVSGKSLLPIQATHFMLYSWLPFDRNQFFASFPPAENRPLKAIRILVGRRVNRPAV